MAVTFTNKAAREMHERLNRMVGQDQRRRPDARHVPQHLRAHAAPRGAAAGLDRDFAIYDTDDQINVVKAALTELNLDEKKYKPAAMHERRSATPRTS